MKTLLEGYIAQQAPLQWSNLFKEAANVAYMVKYAAHAHPPTCICHDGRSTAAAAAAAATAQASPRTRIPTAASLPWHRRYMFRESLPLAKQQFGAYIEDRSNFARVPHAKKQLEVLTILINATFQVIRSHPAASTLAAFRPYHAHAQVTPHHRLTVPPPPRQAYGEVGIFDPEKLATIDFLNQPELLLALVSESTGDGMVRRRRPAACTCPWRRRSESPTAKGRWSLLQLQKGRWSLQLQEAGWSVGWPAFPHAMCVSDPSSVHSRST